MRLFLVNVMKDLNPSINSLLCRVEVGVEGGSVVQTQAK